MAEPGKEGGDWFRWRGGDSFCVHHQLNLRLHGPGDLLVALNVDTNVHKDFH